MRDYKAILGGILQNRLLAVTIIAVFIGISGIIGAISLSDYFSSRGDGHQQLIIGKTSDAISLDPAIATDFESFQVTANIFNNLVTTDAEGAEILPDLAESWDISEDGLTLTFRLKQGISFHDGTPLDGEAVVFNFQRWMDKDSPYHIGQFIYWNQSFGGDPGIIRSVTALSKDTVEIVLNEPYTPILSVLAMPAFGIGSPTAIIKYNEDFMNHPVGTGPFKFSEWADNGEIHLVKNENYFKKEVAIEEVTFKVMAPDADYVAMLESGEIHIVNQITASDVAAMDGTRGVDAYFLPFLNLSYLALNNEKDEFRSLEVRQAVAKVVDRDAMIGAAYDLLSRPAYAFLPPTLFGYSEGYKDIDYDIEEAKALMEKAGYGHGFEAELWVMESPRTYYPDPGKVAQYLKEQMALIDIDVTIVTIPWESYIDEVREGDHDMALVGWQGDYPDPDNFLFTMFYSANTDEGTVLNYSFYSNPGVDAALRQARRTGDSEFRSFIYREIQESLVKDMASVPLAHTMMAMGVSSEVKGFVPHISGTIDLSRLRLQQETGERR